MPADLSAYKVTAGEVSSDVKFDAMIDAVQASLNGIGGSGTAYAAGQILDMAQILQSGASIGQSITWNGTSWVPARAAMDVRLFGTGVGTGDANIDTAALQAMCNQIAGGGIGYIPGGLNLRVNTAVFVSSNCMIVGDGKTSLISAYETDPATSSGGQSIFDLNFENPVANVGQTNLGQNAYDGDLDAILTSVPGYAISPGDIVYLQDSLSASTWSSAVQSYDGNVTVRFSDAIPFDYLTANTAKLIKPGFFGNVVIANLALDGSNNGRIQYNSNHRFRGIMTGKAQNCWFLNLTTSGFQDAAVYLNNTHGCKVINMQDAGSGSSFESVIEVTKSTKTQTLNLDFRRPRGFGYNIAQGFGNQAANTYIDGAGRGFPILTGTTANASQVVTSVSPNTNKLGSLNMDNTRISGPGITSGTQLGASQNYDLTASSQTANVNGGGAPLAFLQVGDGVSGANIPAGTTIQAKGASSITLSQAATGNLTNTSLTFWPALNTKIYLSQAAGAGFGTGNLYITVFARGFKLNSASHNQIENLKSTNSTDTGIAIVNAQITIAGWPGSSFNELNNIECTGSGGGGEDDNGSHGELWMNGRGRNQKNRLTNWIARHNRSAIRRAIMMTPCITTSITFTAGAATATMASTSMIDPGMGIFDSAATPGVPENTYVVSVDSATQITMSHQATVSGARSCALSDNHNNYIAGCWENDQQNHVYGLGNLFINQTRGDYFLACNTSSGSPTISNIGQGVASGNTTKGLVPGMVVKGSGIPYSATVPTVIVSVDSTTQVTISQNATATSPDVPLFFETIGGGGGPASGPSMVEGGQSSLGYVSEPLTVVSNTGVTPATQVLYACANRLRAGTLVTNVVANMTQVPATGGPATLIKLGIADSAGKVLARTANVTGAAWSGGAANTNIASALTVPFVVPYDGVYYALFLEDRTADWTTPLQISRGQLTGDVGTRGVKLVASWAGQTDIPAVGAYVTLNAATAVIPWVVFS